MSSKEVYPSMKEFQSKLASGKAAFEVEFSNFDPEFYKYSGADFLKMANFLRAQAVDGASFIKDMSFLIMLVQTRGVNVDKIANKSSDELKKKFRMMVNTYSIKAHKKALSMEEPSLPRIMSLFPLMIYQFRLMNEPKLQLQGVLGDLPFALAWPGGMAMIKPTDLETQGHFLGWYKSFCLVVKMVFDEKHPMIAMNNSPIPIADRYERLGGL